MISNSDYYVHAIREDDRLKAQTQCLRTSLAAWKRLWSSSPYANIYRYMYIYLFILLFRCTRCPHSTSRIDVHVDSCFSYYIDKSSHVHVFNCFLHIFFSQSAALLRNRVWNVLVSCRFPMWKCCCQGSGASHYDENKNDERDWQQDDVDLEQQK